MLLHELVNIYKQKLWGGDMQRVDLERLIRYVCDDAGVDPDTISFSIEYGSKKLIDGSIRGWAVYSARTVEVWWTGRRWARFKEFGMKRYALSPYEVMLMILRHEVTHIVRGMPPGNAHTPFPMAEASALLTKHRRRWRFAIKALFMKAPHLPYVRTATRTDHTL